MTTQSRWESIARGIRCDDCPIQDNCKVYADDSSPIMSVGTAFDFIEACREVLVNWASKEPVVPSPVWTDELPREEGHYYWRESKKYPPKIFYVFHKSKILWVSTDGRQPIIPLESLPYRCGQWSTRIPEAIEANNDRRTAKRN